MNAPKSFLTWTKQDDLSGALPLKSAERAWLKFEDGSKALDLSSISYHATFGLQHTEIAQAIKDQIDQFAAAPPKAQFELKVKATEELLDYLKLKSPGRIFYTLSGSESVENALKMARQLTQKKIILARQNSYHGASLGALSVTGDWRNPPHFTVDEWTQRIPEPHDPGALERTREIIEKVGAQNICGFILETVPGGNGVMIPTKEWWLGIQKLCREFDLKLIMDEVVCGFERTKGPLGLHHFPIEPDYICLAKGITAGLTPFGALWVNEKEAQHYDQQVLVQGLTHYAHPLGLAAMRKVIEISSSPKFQEHWSALEKVFSGQLKNIEKISLVKEVRRIGLLAAIDLNVKMNLKDFLKNEVHLVCQGQRLILAPPYCLSTDELDQGLKNIAQTLESAV